MAKNVQHVFPNPNGGWNVKKSEAIRASKHFADKQDAVNWARKVSRNQRADLVVHRFDGTIESKDSYGYAPNPPRDRHQA